MNRSLRFLLSAVLAVGAVPAHAASEAFVEGAAAFEDGKTSDSHPQEQAEIAYCAGFWNVWGDALAEEAVGEDDLAALSPILQPLSAPFQAIGLFSKLKESDTLDAEVDEGRNDAELFLKETLAGDLGAAQVLFGTLGACSI